MAAGLLDTSEVIDWHDPSIADKLPDDFAISAITAAELTAGPLLATTPAKAARRQSRQLRPCRGGVVSAGRKPRSRFADLLITANAHANGLDLYSRNPDDFQGLADLIRVVAV